MTHETRTVTITQAEDLSFSVINWGTPRFGATYDETFYQFFHQFARVSTGAAALRNWAMVPSELYLVSGTVPAAQFDVVATMLDEVNQTVIPDLWCGLTGPLPIRQGSAQVFHIVDTRTIGLTDEDSRLFTSNVCR